MDFFEAQDNAIRKTKRLVFFYAVAVVCIVVCVYLAVTVGEFTYHQLSRPEGATYSPMDRMDVVDTGRIVWTAIGVVLLVGMGSLYKTLSLRGGGASVATSLGGERVDRSTNDHKRKQLLNVVEEMAIASGVPVPEVYILNREASINAFAAGWGRDDAVIAVSAGALATLSRDELQGVVAHEYSHVLHGDCRLNIRLMGVLFGIVMLTIFGRLLGSIFRGGIYASGGRRRSSGGGKGNGGALIIAVIVVVILVTIIGYIGSFFARLIQAAISRQREYLADAAAVQFTRNPDGIAGALKKIGSHSTHAVLEHPSASEAAHMFFADGLARGFSSALATHPPLDERIRLIDPQWDGKYDRHRPVKRKPEKAPSEEAAKAARPSGRQMIEGMAILGAIGTMSTGNLATAQQITGAIPESLDSRMRESEGARKVILALVMADNTLDDDAQWKVVEAAFSPDEITSIREAYDQVLALPRETRLAALELSTTTLTQSPLPGREDFLTLLNSLIQVDEHLSLYEFCVRRILRERLARGSGSASSDSSVQYMQLKPEVAKAVGNLLSIVAREAAGAGQPAALVSEAVTPLYLLNGKVSYHEAGEGDMGQLDHSLDILRSSAFAIRAQCLRAVVHCIKADGKLLPEEAESLRMLSLSLDCPAPPLGGALSN
ncbi:M48 family metallopeptidase [Puniceicoccales bacterium CK1056]|uniref:M48 family metallopeptidase n=1 Tax=Oceanipulchritudo coccoides TaxID=2706888 RepID=A0A6B2M3J1_9BACT|nr:M48 family metallopeptidase [Oceanipulchritudo coccoides]NDV63581.1 M48 family metallopeptidase [Oceanipulchritudo coccoides]